MNSGMSGQWFSEETATLGDRITAAREARGMDQPQLARRLGVQPRTISQWEADASEPRANRLQMLAGVLGVTMRWLMTGEGDGVEPDAAPAPATAAVLAEIRQIHAEISRLGSRLAMAEKTLRKAITMPAVAE